jgi:hypothetical protein
VAGWTLNLCLVGAITALFCHTWTEFIAFFTAIAMGMAAVDLIRFKLAHFARGPLTRCRKCGYILRGISEPRCPECGERI